MLDRGSDVYGGSFHDGNFPFKSLGEIRQKEKVRGVSLGGTHSVAQNKVDSMELAFEQEEGEARHSYFGAVQRKGKRALSGPTPLEDAIPDSNSMREANCLEEP